MKWGLRFLCCLVAAASAGAQTVELLPAWDGPIAVDPRSVLTIIPGVRNTDSIPRRFVVALELPPGWRRLIEDRPADILPGQVMQRIVTVFVPQEAKAGDYVIRIKTVSPEDDTVFDVHEVPVRVLPRLEIRLDSLDGSAYVLAGELVEVPLRVSNVSNTAMRVNLTMSTRLYAPAEFVGAPDGLLVLDSGESARIVATIRAPQTLARVQRFTIQINATGTPVDDEMGTAVPVRVSFVSTVEVIPVASEEPLPRLTIPARFEAETSHTAGPDWAGALALSLSGGGVVDRLGQHSIDFTFRPSVDLDEPRIGSPNDTYKLNYSGPSLDVLLGDNTYRFSPLLGASRSGRGVIGSYRLGQMGVTGLYHFPAAYGTSAATAAAILDFTAPDDTLPGGYRYRSSFSLAAPPGVDFVSSTYHDFVYSATTRADLDLAIGRTPDHPVVWAARAGGAAPVGPLDLTAAALYGSPGYPGGMSDQVRLRGSTRASLPRIGLDLGLDSSLRQENLSGSGGARPRHLTTGLNGSLLLRQLAVQLNAGWMLRSRADVVPDPTFNTLSNAYSLGARFAMNKLSLSGDAKLEVKDDLLWGLRVYEQRYRIAAQWSVSRETRYTGRLSYRITHGPASPTTRRVAFGVGAAHVLGPVESRARAVLEVTSRGGDLANIGLLADAGARIPIRANDTLSLAAYLKQGWGPADAGVSGGFSVGYSAPLSIPVTRVRGFGVIEGFVFDAQTGDPVGNVMIRVSDRAVVTGPDGAFRLTSLHPGEYHVRVDTSRLSSGYVVDRPLPLWVSVDSDVAAMLEIPIVRGAAVSGTIALYAAPEAREGYLGTATVNGIRNDREYPDDELELIGGLSDALVSVRSFDERRRVLTNRQGHFVFSDLRPGTWTVSVEDAGLPRDHRFVESELVVMLEPGGIESLTFDVVPLRRRVQLLSVSEEPVVAVIARVAAVETSDTVDDPDSSQPEDSVLTISLPRRESVTAETERLDAVPGDPGRDRSRFDRLAHLAELRQRQTRLESPRLLGLPWGVSAQASEFLLRDYLAEGLSEVGTEQLSDMIRVRRYTGAGTVLADLKGSVTLDFLCLGEDEPETHLVGVRVDVQADRNALIRGDLAQRYYETVALLQARWKVEYLEEEFTAVTEVRHVRVGGIEIRLVLDPEHGSFTVEYLDDWFFRAEQSILELGM